MKNKNRSAPAESGAEALVADICGVTARPYRPAEEAAVEVSKNLRHYYREQFRSMCAFMESRLSQSLTVEELCAYTGLSRATITRIFRCCAGMGAIRYFQALRIKEAKRLIRTGSKSMTEIAQTLGFSTIHHFSRVFKQTTGLSPREYAKMLC